MSAAKANVAGLLTHAASTFGPRTAVVHGERRLTYGELNARANRLAGTLAASGVARGDRVALLQRNGPELLESLFGCFKAGAVAVPINARLHPREYQYIIGNAEAKVVVFTEDFRRGIAGIRGDLPLVLRYLEIGSSLSGSESYEHALAAGDASRVDAEVGPDDLAWLFYTSGTTGKPKGAMVTHGNLGFMSDRYVEEVYRPGPSDVVMHAGPLTHGSGLWALPITASGATQLIPEGGRFDPEQIFALIAARKVTKIAFVAPTMLTMLLNSPAVDRYDTSSLRCIGYGGGPMYVEDLKRAIRRFGPILCQIYGQGECPMTISMLAPEDHDVRGDERKEARLASAGRIRGGLEVVVLDASDQVLPPGAVGEIAVRGPVVMKGYWKSAEATAEAFRAGWYHTGDLGRIDEDGYVFLLDRKKEMIISGGANIYPREVEEVLLMHPGVLEVAVVGVPDRLWGESVLAVIRPRAGMRPQESELVELCRDHLAGYKKPRFFRFVDDLPKNAYGKVLKRELRQQYAGLGEAPA